MIGFSSKMLNRPQKLCFARPANMVQIECRLQLEPNMHDIPENWIQAKFERYIVKQVSIPNLLLEL